MQGELAPAKRLFQRLVAMRSNYLGTVDHSVEDDVLRTILLTEVRFQLQSTIDPETLSSVNTTMQMFKARGFKVRAFQWSALYIAMLRQSQESVISRELFPDLATWIESESIVSFFDGLGVSRQLQDYPLKNTLNQCLIDTAKLSLNVEPINNREHEVITLVAQGMTNKEVAKHLSIGAETVKWRLKIIYGKLQVRNRTEAVSRARRLSLIN